MDLIRILVLQARAFLLEGGWDQALSTLERALCLAEPEGYVRTFVDEGEAIARLLAQIPEAQQQGRRALTTSCGGTETHGIAPDYVRRLLVAFGESPQATSPATLALIEPLTERELEVLRLVAVGLSNREIAEQLVVAVSTVKSHINHLYGKLEVKNRTQAVARGRELELL